MSRSRLFLAAALLATMALAAAMRLPGLSQRPMHADEANQAVKAAGCTNRASTITTPPTITALRCTG